MKGDDIAARLVVFAADVFNVLAALPTNHVGKHVADQLLRSSTGGGSNYEEARGAESRRDFAHKVSVAVKELREAVYWLNLVERASLSPGITMRDLIREGNELVAILAASAKTARMGTGEPGRGTGTGRISNR